MRGKFLLIGCGTLGVLFVVVLLWYIDSSDTGRRVQGLESGEGRSGSVCACVAEEVNDK